MIAGYRMKSSFFTAAPIIAMMDAKTRAALSKFGAGVRRVAQRSLKYGKGVSSPGQPPIVHRSDSRIRVSKSTGKSRTVNFSPLREYLYFAYDADEKTVVIGPELFRAAKSQGVAEALEHGGSVQVTKGGGKVKVEFIRPRPFMQPAFEKELPNAPKLWAE